MWGKRAHLCIMSRDWWSWDCFVVCLVSVLSCGCLASLLSCLVGPSSCECLVFVFTGSLCWLVFAFHFAFVRLVSVNVFDLTRLCINISKSLFVLWLSRPVVFLSWDSLVAWLSCRVIALSCYYHIFGLAVSCRVNVLSCLEMCKSLLFCP